MSPKLPTKLPPSLCELWRTSATKNGKAREVEMPGECPAKTRTAIREVRGGRTDTQRKAPGRESGAAPAPVKTAFMRVWVIGRHLFVTA